MVVKKVVYENEFRKATFMNEEEMIAAWGKLEDNSFILQQRKELKEFTERIQNIRKRLNIEP